MQPEKYENYEVGLKWDVTESLAFTAEAYEVDRTNVRFAQPNGTFLQTGKSEVQGIEVTLTGNVTDRWQVAAGYGHQTGELTSATSAVLVAGTPLPLLPSDTFSLWNRYQLTPGLGVGMGVVYHSEFFAALQPASNLVELPAFTTVDTALYYRINDHLRVQLNATNIFNEGYIVSAVRPGFLHLRNVSLMLLNDEAITQNTDFAPRCCIFISGRPQLRMS